jgi:osmoprotectant transport system ATP-binding protein
MQNGLAIEFRDASFGLPGNPEMVRGLTLAIPRGEMLILLGRSGSGKTTSLKLINHLLTPTGGEVRVENRATTDWDEIKLRRGIGYVIQEAGLFPHFTIERNIALVPKIEGWDRNKIRARVSELLGLVGLSAEVAKRYPKALSGGQRQRVGVARALAADPPILLMDEPFAALDPITRAELQREFLQLQQRLRKTVVFVTHDFREALLLADRIALMDSGKLVALHSPKEFLESNNQFVRAYREAFSNDFVADIKSETRKEVV